MSKIPKFVSVEPKDENYEDASLLEKLWNYCIEEDLERRKRQWFFGVLFGYNGLSRYYWDKPKGEVDE